MWCRRISVARHLGNCRLNLGRTRSLDIDLIHEAREARLNAIRIWLRHKDRACRCRLRRCRDAEHLGLGGTERHHDEIILVLAIGRLTFGGERPDDAQRHALDQDDGAHRIVRGSKQIAKDSLADDRHQRGAALVFGADAATGGDLPVRDRRIVGSDALDVGRPILAGIFSLTRLPDQVGDFARRLVLAPDCQSVGNGEGRGTARPPASAHARHRPWNNDDQVGAEARELFLHGIVGALPDGNHDDQRRHADKDAEHGQCRAHLVTRKRLHRRGQDHQAEGPGKRGAARGFCR